MKNELLAAMFIATAAATTAGCGAGNGSPTATVTVTSQASAPATSRSASRPTSQEEGPAYVEDGPAQVERVQVPSFIGMSYVEAVQYYHSLGLTDGGYSFPHDPAMTQCPIDNPLGWVTAQDPKPGAEVQPRTHVFFDLTCIP